MDDIRGEPESSLTQRKAGQAPAKSDEQARIERRRIGPESEVRGGPEAPNQQE